MKILSDEIERVAVALGANYIRSSSLNESNIQVHFSEIDGATIIFAGVPNVQTQYEGAQVIDNYVGVELYFVVKKPHDEMDANVLDDLFEQTHQLAANFSFQVRTERDIDSYNLEAVTILDDMLVGYMMTVTLPMNGLHCTFGV